MNSKNITIIHVQRVTLADFSRGAEKTLRGVNTQYNQCLGLNVLHSSFMELPHTQGGTHMSRCGSGALI